MIVSDFHLNINDIPGWIIAAVTVTSLWKTWRADRRIAKTMELAHTTAAQIDLIHKETNSMRATLEDAAVARGILEGRGQVKTEIADQVIRLDVKPTA